MTEEDDLAERLRELIGDGSLRGFASTARVNEATLRSVLKGHRPSVDFVVAVAVAHRVSIAWLAAGIGSKWPADPVALNSEHLEDALSIVEGWLADNERVMPPEKKAKVVTQLYEFIADDAARGRGPVDVKRLHGILRLVA